MEAGALTIRQCLRATPSRLCIIGQATRRPVSRLPTSIALGLAPIVIIIIPLFYPPSSVLSALTLVRYFLYFVD